MNPAVLFFKDTIEDDSSDGEELLSTDEEITCVAAEAVACSSNMLLNTERKRSFERSNRFMLTTVTNFNDREFQENFRMTREAFNWLLEKTEESLQNFSYGPDTVSPKKQLLAAIWLLSTPDSFRSVAGRFDMAKSTLFKCFERVIDKLNTLGSDLIKWPGEEERKEIKEDFYKWGKLPGVIGAIDGTYVPIKAPEENPEVYINRKCVYAITLQAICDNKRRFIDVFTGYPSSVSDNRIFKNSNIFKAICNNPDNYFSQGEFIIGDKAYPVLKWCIPPYIDRGNLTHSQHAKTRQLIERTFALLFGRFRRLKYLDMSKARLIPKVILAACILHNICLKFPDELTDSYMAEESVNGDEGDNSATSEMYDSNQSKEEGNEIRNQIADLLLNM